MPEHFSEDEARRIFARAAERQRTETPGPDGLSLSELQEIGAAAGLDPAHVAAAVAEVQLAAVRPSPEARAFLGAPVEVRASRVLSAPVTDEAWEQMVARLRKTFDAKGTPTDVGRVREWTGTNSRGGLSNLQATVEPVEGGARVTLETSRAEEAKGLRAAPVAVVGMAALFSAFFVFGEFEPMAWVLPAFLLAAGAIMAIGGRVAFARWSAERARQFDALLDQFELIVRDAAPEGESLEDPAGAVPASPPLDLDALEPPEGARGADASRRRARS